MLGAEEQADTAAAALDVWFPSGVVGGEGKLPLFMF